MMDTKDSIMDAAERLFAERGFEATSLRAITAAAGVNLAAVNYHFQSKDQLLQALFTRRLELLNRKRMEMMDVYEAEYGERPVPPDKLVRALIEPMFDASSDRTVRSNAFSVLLGRMYSSPHGRLESILLSDIQEFAERFSAAIRRTLPEIPPEELYWKVFFSLGATIHSLTASHLLQKISRGICDPDNREATLEKLVAFIVAGLKTPVAAGARSIRSVKTNKGI